MGRRKISLRTRVTEIFILIMAVVILMVWVTNNWLLPRYYMNYKIKVLQNGYQVIDEMVSHDTDGQSVLEEVQEELKKVPGFGGRRRNNEEQNPEEESTIGPEAEKIVNMIRDLRDKSNISIYVYDTMRGSEIIASSREKDMMRNNLMLYILGLNERKTSILEEHENYVIQRTYDPVRKNVTLESWGYFSDNGTVFLMTTPMDSISESASISTMFLIRVSFVVMIIGSLIIYLATGVVTRQIHKLSESSEKMSQLDFSEKFTERTSISEIETLGMSMNTMSDKLEHVIGELHEANARLQRDIDEKTKIDEMRKEFVANVSHELKTPIALIQGYAEGLTEGMAEDPESRDYYCNVIQDEAQKMNKMVKQLLTLSAIEYGADRLEIERFDLTYLIRSCIEASGIMLRQKDISVEFSEEEPVYVMGDEFKIEEVITNYLSNAINHVNEDRLIRIRIERRVKNERGQVRVSVYNSGENIPEEILENLWTKFYKADKSRTRAYGGTGIGLSIVKAIMDGHGREYGVTNVTDGVEFWFELDEA